jgi:hypothetical protein
MSDLTHAERHAYQQPEAVGYAAWYTLDGVVVAFEQLDGTIVTEW